MGRPLRMASQRPGIGRVPMGGEFVQLVGGPMKLIYGYKSVAEEMAAFARGETEVVTCLERRLPRMYPELIEKKRLVPIFWWNAPPSEGWLKKLESQDAAQHPRSARAQDQRVPEGGVQHGREHSPVAEGLHAAAEGAQGHRGYVAQGVQGHHRGPGVREDRQLSPATTWATDLRSITRSSSPPSRTCLRTARCSSRS